MLCTVEDIEKRTGETYTGTELARVNGFIEDVSALITTFCRSKGHTLPDPAPLDVKAIATIEVRRHLNLEPGVSNERLDVISTSYTDSGRAVALSDGAKDDLKTYVRSTRKTGLRTIRLVRPEDWPEETTP